MFARFCVLLRAAFRFGFRPTVEALGGHIEYFITLFLSVLLFPYPLFFLFPSLFPFPFLFPSLFLFLYLFPFAFSIFFLFLFLFLFALPPYMPLPVPYTLLEQFSRPYDNILFYSSYVLGVRSDMESTVYVVD